MAAADSSEPRRKGSSRGHRQIEERAVAIGKKVAPLLDPSSIAASLDTLATAAYQLQSAEPDVSEGLTGLAVILQAARTSQTFQSSVSHLEPRGLLAPSKPPAPTQPPPSLEFAPSELGPRSTRGLIQNNPQSNGEDSADLDPKKRLTCHLCDKRFPKLYDLKRHIRSHTGEKPFVCDVPGCNKGFVQKSALSVHSRVHTGEKPYQCEYPGCSVSFGDVSALTRHRRRHGVNNFSWKCAEPGCPRAFTRKAALLAHKGKVHTNNQDSREGNETRPNEGETDEEGNEEEPNSASDEE